MMVYEDLNFNDKLTENQIAMLKKAETMTIQFDDNCPELTDEQLAKFAEVARDRRKKLQNKQTVAIRLSPQALLKAKSLGKGYTTILSRILEKVLADNDTMEHFL